MITDGARFIRAAYTDETIIVSVRDVTALARWIGADADGAPVPAAVLGSPR